MAGGERLVALSLWFYYNENQKQYEERREKDGQNTICIRLGRNITQ